MSVQVAEYVDMGADEWRWFKKYVASYHPYTSTTPADAVQDGERTADVREQWNEWDMIARQNVPDSVADDLANAFYVEMTVDAAAAHADVHQAHAFGAYMRSDAPDSRNLPYLSHDRSGLADDDRIELLQLLEDGATTDEVVEQVGPPDHNVERLASNYRSR